MEIDSGSCRNPGVSDTKQLAIGLSTHRLCERRFIAQEYDESSKLGILAKDGLIESGKRKDFTQ